jgi:hypothetical protein
MEKHNKPIALSLTTIIVHELGKVTIVVGAIP